jgi:taurine dioxygenase
VQDMLTRIESYKRIRVQPLAGALGAEIEGVDLSRPLDDATFAEIRRAFTDFLVIFFRDQTLDPQTFGEFIGRFGALRMSPYSKPRADHPFVTDLIRREDMAPGMRNVGDRWHSDHAPQERPALGFALYCLQAPPWGGDTVFANLYRAYEGLSDDMKALCERLIVMHSRSGVFGPDGRGGPGGKKPLVHAGMEERYSIDEAKLRDLATETPHPLVRIHPESGRKFLFITGDYAIRFQGMTPDESMPLINYLNQQVSRLENTCRFRWRKGSLTVMDNRCTQHYAINDYSGFRREMLRLEIEGERPYGPAMPREGAQLKATA